MKELLKITNFINVYFQLDKLKFLEVSVKNLIIRGLS